jgi:site-specific recombinase XerD
VLKEDSMTFSKAAADALLYLAKVRGYSPRTIDNYTLGASQFVTFLRARQALDAVESFTVESVMNFATELGTMGHGANTILNKLAGLSAIARWLMIQTDGRGKPRLLMDPTKGFEPPRRVKPKTQFLRPADAAKFISVELLGYQRLACDLLLDTGMRCSELCDANVGDLQNNDGDYALVVPVKGRKQEGAEPGVYPVSADVVDALLTSLRDRGVKDQPDAPLLINSHGDRWTRTGLGQMVADAGTKAGIVNYRLSPHKLRHTANVLALQAGLDAPTRAAMLNHRSQSTLARYDHLLDGATHEGRAKQRAALRSYAQRGYDSALGQSGAEGTPK